MGSVPGDSDFQSDWSDQPKPARGLTRPDLGSMPMTKPQFGGSLSALGSGPLGSEPGCVPQGGPGGPLGSVRPDLGSVPKLPELGSILSSGRRLTVPVSYEDSGIESSEFQDSLAIHEFQNSMAMHRQIPDGKDNKESVSGSDSIPELEEALANLSQESVEERRKRMFRFVEDIFY